MTTLQNRQLANLPVVTTSSLILNLPNAAVGAPGNLIVAMATDAMVTFSVDITETPIKAVLLSTTEDMVIANTGGVGGIAISAGQSLYLPIYNLDPTHPNAPIYWMLNSPGGDAGALIFV